MQIIFHKISAHSKFFNYIVALYERSFPADERRGMDSFLQIVRGERRFNLVAITDISERFLGFVAYWQFFAFTYLEHFAVADEFRGQGIGTEILQQCIAKLWRLPLVLEVEPGVTPIASRRISFYERLGLKAWPKVLYVQPPYDSGKQPVVLVIMTLGVDCEDDVKAMISVMRSRVYGCKG